MPTIKTTRISTLKSTNPDSGGWMVLDPPDYPAELITFLSNDVEVASVINEKTFSLEEAPTIFYFIQKINNIDLLLTNNLSKKSYGIEG